MRVAGRKQAGRLFLRQKAEKTMMETDESNGSFGSLVCHFSVEKRRAAVEIFKERTVFDETSLELAWILRL